MIKVLIVDDEILIRVGIKSCLDWEKHGFEIVGQAENGIKALEIVKDTHPDIILTDIKMPKMGGLELIEQVKKLFPDIKIIVLSCYNEIDYVKKAIKLGAEDYILKLSIEPENLLEVMTKAKQTIENGSLNEDSRQSLNESKLNQYVIKENIYKKMAAGSINPKEFAKELSSVGVDVASGSYLVLCCGIDDYNHAPARSKIDDRYLFKFSFINIFEESMSNYTKCDIAELEKGEYIILLRYSGAYDPLCGREMLAGCLKRINNSFKKYLNISISFGVSLMPVKYTDIHQIYLNARTAMQYKFYSGRESINFCNEISGFSNKDLLFKYDDENRLIEKLDDFDEPGVKKVINDFFAEIIQSGAYDPVNVRNVSTEIYHTLMKFIKKFGVESNFVQTNFSEHPLNFLNSAETASDITQWFAGFIDKMFEFVYNQQLNAKRPEILKLQKYITENIGENITLDKAAKISNISKCYLSTLFKKETGYAFVDYVNKAKMDRARILIQEHNMKIYQAAERVGINDDSYFSKLFKKYMGVSPSKLIKSSK